MTEMLASGDRGGAKDEIAAEQSRTAPREPAGACIALGSNLGDRRAMLEAAIAKLAAAEGVAVSRRSSIRETAPVGGPPQGPFLNGAVEVRTSLSARELLDLLLAIELSLGRVREERFGPRTIDLDLLLYGDLIINEPGLEVPHPRILERAFVLEPLAEIAPEWRHPRTGRTLAEHWRDLAGPEGAP